MLLPRVHGRLPENCRRRTPESSTKNARAGRSLGMVCAAPPTFGSRRHRQRALPTPPHGRTTAPHAAGCAGRPTRSPPPSGSGAGAARAPPLWGGRPPLQKSGGEPKTKKKGQSPGGGGSFVFPPPPPKKTP